jgi:hypothetical protein
MNLLRWFLPLEGCTSLDVICSRWHPLLEEHYLNPGAEDSRYEDAIMSFLANARLPAALKLGVILSCVSSADLDLRLAVGLLDEEVEAESREWPRMVEVATALNGPAPAFPTADPWLAAFVTGRLVGLRDTLGHDGTTACLWHSVFWDKYLELACRWADKGSVKLALQRGAQVQYDSWAALIATVEGAHSHALRTPYYTEGRTNADYREILQLLIASGVDLPPVSDIVLPAAAAVDNVDMLNELVTRGVSLESAGPTALYVAASNFAASAVNWLLAKGVCVHEGNDAALRGAVESLNEPMVETLLAAGADIHASVELPLCVAATAQPADLFNGEDDFINERADMIALLIRSGADAHHPTFAAKLTGAPDGREVLELLSKHETLDGHNRALFSSLLTTMATDEHG